MKTLLITGASVGIGLATARRFAAAGYAVTNISRRPCALPSVNHLPGDLSEANFLDALSERLDEALAGADAVSVIHNAARLLNDSAADTPSDQLRAVMEVNLAAPNTLNRFVIPRLPPGSSILYVGSTLAEKAVPNSFSYVVTKHALVGMMRATCQDLAGRGIHTACICPGFTDTEMLRAHVPEEAMDAVRGLSAYGRLIDPSEIADTLLWAAQSPVVNGAVLHANLGQVER
ncbi:MAG: SDR family NAD(P)-dependent oxidoreductase [Gammaproteobacteria bacterium]|nr:SDR family NAD(P)-dependent oxidoreductase [Gammaproteobacteria bacterium]MCY4343979.1 SDR family NAD(P)-dependent oxidoreductase [Gammaproteobacteria bacterium]